MRRRAVWVRLFAVLTSTPLYAQNAQNADAINDLKAKIFDVIVGEPDAARGHEAADGRRLIGPVDAIHRVAEIQRPRA